MGMSNAPTIQARNSNLYRNAKGRFARVDWSAPPAVEVRFSVDYVGPPKPRALGVWDRLRRVARL